MTVHGITPTRSTSGEVRLLLLILMEGAVVEIVVAGVGSVEHVRMWKRMLLGGKIGILLLRVSS